MEKAVDTLVKWALLLKYEIIEKIEQGRIATIYKALHKSSDRLVLLKVISLDLVKDNEFLNRFMEIADLRREIKHPNIENIIEIDKSEEILFVATEFYEGLELSKFISQNNQLSADQTLQIISPISEALVVAHAKNLIHYDIKSSNIIITKEGKLILKDFGFTYAASVSKLTKKDKTITNPEYKSPEQVGDKKIDYRTDLYSLGVVMYECLTGKVPFKANKPLATALSIMGDAPKEVKDIVQVEEKYNNIVKQLLEKEAEQRISSAEELFNRLGIDKNKIQKSIEIGEGKIDLNYTKCIKCEKHFNPTDKKDNIEICPECTEPTEYEQETIRTLNNVATQLINDGDYEAAFYKFEEIEKLDAGNIDAQKGKDICIKGAWKFEEKENQTLSDGVLDEVENIDEKELDNKKSDDIGNFEDKKLYNKKSDDLGNFEDKKLYNKKSDDLGNFEDKKL